MENEVLEMKLDVMPELLDLISKVEAEGVGGVKFLTHWAYFPKQSSPDVMGQGAMGFAGAYEWDVSVRVYEDGRMFYGAYWRVKDKYDDDNWETHKMDSDYEEAE
jgi:hypothetical protein